MSLHGRILLGPYIGVLTGVLAGFVTFLLPFGFRYVAGVTFPSRMSLLLRLGVAGFQGSLYGLMRTPALITSPTILTALLVVLLATLYAHERGKELAKAAPKGSFGGSGGADSRRRSSGTSGGSARCAFASPGP